jgi:hypothetical protein
VLQTSVENRTAERYHHHNSRNMRFIPVHYMTETIFLLLFGNFYRMCVCITLHHWLSFVARILQPDDHRLKATFEQTMYQLVASSRVWLILSSK